MKAKDLKVNGEYLSCATKNWETSTYVGTGYGSTRRVRVLDTTPGPWTHREGTGYVRGAGYSFQTTNGVLVAVLDPKTGEYTDRNAVVSLASLRGPWTATWARVQENAGVARQAREDSNRTHREGLARVESVLARLGRLADFHTGAYVLQAHQAVVSVEVLERIADRLEGK